MAAAETAIPEIALDAVWQVLRCSHCLLRRFCRTSAFCRHRWAPLHLLGTRCSLSARPASAPPSATSATSAFMPTCAAGCGQPRASTCARATPCYLASAEAELALCRALPVACACSPRHPAHRATAPSCRHGRQSAQSRAFHPAPRCALLAGAAHCASTVRCSARARARSPRHCTRPDERCSARARARSPRHCTRPVQGEWPVTSPPSTPSA